MFLLNLVGLVVCGEHGPWIFDGVCFARGEGARQSQRVEEFRWKMDGSGHGQS